MKRVIVLLFIFIIIDSSFNNDSCLCQWVQKSSGIGTNSALVNNINPETKLSIDTITPKYFPLAVGNVYKYHYASSNFYNYDYIVRIIKDTIINSKRYFLVNQYFPGFIGSILRFDSTTGNIYSRKSTGYCSYSPFEELVDSLCARIGDTTLVCTPYIPKHYCLDTGFVALFGTQVKRKIFSHNTSEVFTSITYGLNFGIIFAAYSDFWGVASESLVGCYINGILYGDTTLSSIKQISSTTPDKYTLYQNYPNPFNPNTNIKFDIQKTSPIKLVIYDALGREVATLVNEELKAGSYQVSWDGSNYTSGVYFYTLQAGDYIETKKMLLLK